MSFQTTKSLVLYVDFLGVSSAAKEWSSDDLATLLETLTQIASWRGEYVSLGNYDESSPPNATSFSDHVVLSYPLKRTLLNVGGHESNLNMLSSLRFRAAYLAQMAMDIGLLVRGALTIGQLYHKSAVVFGKAMVEAHLLESKSAFYPRIIVTDELASWAVDQEAFLTDRDGVRHLDYFGDMRMLGHMNHGDDWSDKVNAFVDFTIDDLSKTQRRNERSKWVWFRGQFNAARVPTLSDVIARSKSSALSKE